MTEREQQQPLTKEVSLRFPDGSVGPGSEKTGGIFDGNDEKSEPLSYLTRKDDYEPPIPEPPENEIEEAARKGVDKNTGLTTQPKWLSVLKKRQPPWFFVRWAMCNCFCNPRFTMTRAQWIWFVELICLAAHAYYAWLMWGEANDGKGEHAWEVTVWRIHPQWNSTHTDGYTALLVDNLRPIRIDILITGLFLISAAVHLFQVALGPFDRWIWLYWRQLDLCFHWWRYLNFSLTLPAMVMIICCLSHLREQNAIAACFMLMWCTVSGWFLTELWSRPHRNSDRSYDMNRWLGDEAPIKPGQPWTRLTPEEVCQRAMQRSRRRLNYIIRLVPTVISVFPFVALWTIILNNFFVQLDDLRLEEGDPLYHRIPEFVPMAVMGLLFFSILFFFPLMWWQWAPPRHYWVRCPLNAFCLYTPSNLLFLPFAENRDSLQPAGPCPQAHAWIPSLPKSSQGKQLQRCHDVGQEHDCTGAWHHRSHNHDHHNSHGWRHRCNHRSDVYGGECLLAVAVSPPCCVRDKHVWEWKSECPVLEGYEKRERGRESVRTRV